MALSGGVFLWLTPLTRRKVTQPETDSGMGNQVADPLYGTKAMSFLFGGRTQKLKTMNRILTDAARERSKRIKELERQIAQLQRELEPARRAIERARELELVADERARLVNEKDEQLAIVREALTKGARVINEKDEELAIVREALTKCSSRIQDLEHTLAEARAMLQET
jgi:iron-sulfur cluster repair protein YtfE (RIC family)